MRILGEVSCGSDETMAIAFVDVGEHVTRCEDWGREVRWRQGVR